MRVFIVLIGFLIVTSSALAADFSSGPPPAPPSVYAPVYIAPWPPPPPPYDWGGFYIGANGGYGWARATGALSIVGLISFPASGNTDGTIANGQLGFNWQMGALVLGIEGDGDW
jgi:outer membrane immunogenic protein